MAWIGYIKGIWQITSYLHTTIKQVYFNARFIRNTKVSHAYFSVAILTSAMLTLALCMRTLVC